MADIDSQIENSAQADAASPAGQDEDNTGSRQWGRIFLMLSVPLVVLIIGAYFWMVSGRVAETDNAYVQQQKLSISSEIGGKIVEVAVAENQQVKKGDLLFRIDPEPYRLAIQQAESAIASAQVTRQTQITDYEATSVNIDAAREDIAFAQSKLVRQKALWERGFTTRADYDAAQHAVTQAQKQLRVAQSSSAMAKARLATGAALPGQDPEIVAAQLRRDQALLDLSKTEIRASMDGRVTQADRLILGQMMLSGLPALSLVANNDSWIEANFKETDLTRMKVGQAATIKLDTYPDLVLDGYISSIGAGTGSEFSVLPAQNATGNWVKVVQRVPVRINIKSETHPTLIAGLSATVSVDLQQPKSR